MRTGMPRNAQKLPSCSDQSVDRSKKQICLETLISIEQNGRNAI